MREYLPFSSARSREPELFRPADEVRSKALARTGRFDARPGLGHLFEHDAQFESREVRAQT